MNCRQPYIAVQYFFVLFVDVQSSWATNSPQPLPPGGCRGLSRQLGSLPLLKEIKPPDRHITWYSVTLFLLSFTFSSYLFIFYLSFSLSLFLVHFSFFNMYQAPKSRPPHHLILFHTLSPFFFSFTSLFEFFSFFSRSLFSFQHISSLHTALSPVFGSWINPSYCFPLLTQKKNEKYIHNQ